MKRDQVFEFFRRLAEENPSPTTELESGNPYQLLVAVVLSAQATDASVNIACRPLFERIRAPNQMIDFGEERLRSARTNGQCPDNLVIVLREERDDRSSHRPSVPRERITAPGVAATHQVLGRLNLISPQSDQAPYALAS